MRGYVRSEISMETEKIRVETGKILMISSFLFFSTVILKSLFIQFLVNSSNRKKKHHEKKKGKMSCKSENSPLKRENNRSYFENTLVPLL